MSGGSNSVKETAYEKQLATIAQQELSQYKETIIPFRNKWIADVTGDTTAVENGISGQGNADLAQKRAQRTALSGVDPSSGVAQSKASALKWGDAGAAAALNATQTVREQQAVGLQNAISAIRGEDVDAQSGLQSAASDSVEKAISDAQGEAATKAVTASSIASAIGAGAGIYKNRPNTSNEDLNVIRDQNSRLL
jgi:hypothetical protein